MAESFLGLESARVLNTDDYLLTRRAIDDLARVKGMGVIHGDAGLGKTYSVRSALERLRGVDVSWFDFPGRTTTKAVVQALLREITGIDHEGTRPRLELLLLDQLSGRPRVLVVDEAQRLYDEIIEYLRHLYDRPNTRFALVLVGGNDCWSRVSSYPMVWSRVYRCIGFQPLSSDEVLRHVPRFHPVYGEVPPALIADIDAAFGHGNLRNWTKFTIDALALMRENDRDALSEDVVQAIFALHASGAGRAR